MTSLQDECLHKVQGCKGASSVVTQPLDSEPTTPMASDLLNPAVSHLSTSHAVLTEQKEREGGKNESMK